MKLAAIAALVAQGESETLEFKRSTGTRRKGAQTICAMLNHRGGQVLFGVTPEGTIIGQDVSDRTIEQLSEEFRNIEPTILPEIRRVPVTKRLEVLAVSVKQGPFRPYRYRGSAYRRVGNTTLSMSGHESQQVLLERLHSEQRWENQCAEGWSIDDLDQEEIQRTVEEAIRRGRLADPGTRQPTALLRGFHLLLADGTLKRSAAVLFGKKACLEAELPQCLLRVARFRGVGRAEFRDNRQFRGHAFYLLAQAENFLVENVQVAGRIEANRLDRVDEPLYPPAAVREALINAFCHRDYTMAGGSVGLALYDDRLEVTSAGTLHFGLTPEQLFGPHESIPWNPLIAKVFYFRGMIEQWGRGTIRMLELANLAGLPPPAIQDRAGSVSVQFRHSRYSPPHRVGRDLTERQRMILTVLQQSPGGLALREICARLGQQGSERQVREDLAALRTLGLAAPAGHGRGARWALA